MKVLNLTTFPVTPAMANLGIFDNNDHRIIRSLMRFTELPSVAERERRASILANIALDCSCDAVLVYGAPYFISYIEAALIANGLSVVYPYNGKKKYSEIIGLVGLDDLKRST